jgi:hypothetical protein
MKGIKPGKILTTICVEIEGEPVVVTPPIRPNTDGVLTLNAMDATVHGSDARLEGNGTNANIGYWTNKDDYVTWEFELPAKGSYDVLLEYASVQAAHLAKIEVELNGGSKIGYELPATGGWQTYKSIRLGAFGFPAGGKYTLTVRPVEMKNGFVMNLRRIVLSPASP